MSARSTLLWRVTFRHLLLVCKDNEAVQSVFSRLVSQQQLQAFRTSLLTFLRLVVGPWLAEQEGENLEEGDALLQRLQLAETALKSS